MILVASTMNFVVTLGSLAQRGLVARLLLLLLLLLLLSTSPVVVVVSAGWVLPSSRCTTATTRTASGAARGRTVLLPRSSTSTTSTLPRTLVQVAAAVSVPNYCSDCGSNQMRVSVPRNDHCERAVCPDCGHIVYVNPKIVVACVILDNTSTTPATTSSSSNNEERCLLGQRAIEPRAGYWGFPQGFMEQGETSREAAVREVMEEFQLRLPPSALKLRAIYNLPGSVQIVYEARIDPASTTTTTTMPSTWECSAIAWFPRNQLPELCFPTVQWALDHCWSITDNNSNNRIQQKTKAYDAALERWIAVEDEPLEDATNFSV